MEDFLVLEELEIIRTISQPYRIKILQCFHDGLPATAKQISDKMNEPHAKINYHIKTLHKAGILNLIDEKVKLGIVEKYYLPSARIFIIAKCIGEEAFPFLTDSEKNQLTNILENAVKRFIMERESKGVKI